MTHFTNESFIRVRNDSGAALPAHGDATDPVEQAVRLDHTFQCCHVRRPGNGNGDSGDPGPHRHDASAHLHEGVVHLTHGGIEPEAYIEPGHDHPVHDLAAVHRHRGHIDQGLNSRFCRVSHKKDPLTLPDGRYLNHIGGAVLMAVRDNQPDHVSSQLIDHERGPRGVWSDEYRAAARGGGKETPLVGENVAVHIGGFAAVESDGAIEDHRLIGAGIVHRPVG